MPSTNASSTTSPPSGSRSRLRGFSYLRSHAHHHNSNSNNSNNNNNNNSGNSNTSSNNNANNNNLTTPVTAEQMANNNASLSPPGSPTSPRRSTSPLTNNNTTANGGGTSSWLPTVGGVSGLSRVPTAPAAESSNAVRSHSPSGKLAADGAPLVRAVSEGMPLSRSIDAALSTGNDNAVASTSTSTSQTGAAGAAGAASQIQQTAIDPQQPAPSIRFVPHIDPRSTRQSLTFSPMERTLRHNDEVIRVGRYSDRDAGNPTPVGFKSKVVSRRHCEFWCHKGQWYVKDVKSSSGTFLNHIRLSSPGVESKAFPLFDGDIIQLGIDFKGGEELIFRCVKIRVELNRAWQKGLNNFNVSTHKKLQALGKSLAKPKDSDSSSTHTSECAICLMNVAPCQSLFVAPCSHVWHYKCVRPIILKSYPTFLCPNCRAVADLERDIEEDNTWQVVEDEPAPPVQPNVNTQSDHDEDGVVVVTSAQPPPATATATAGGTVSASPSSPADLPMEPERPAPPAPTRIPPEIAVNVNGVGNQDDGQMVGNEVTNDDRLHIQEPASPSASAASAPSLVDDGDGDGDSGHQQIMSGANGTFVSLDSDNNDNAELQHSVAAMAMLDLNNVPDVADNGEGSSSQPTSAIPARKPVRNSSDGPPTLSLGLPAGGPSRRDTSSPENTTNGDNGPLTPKNHIGPFVLDGLVDRS